MRDSTAEGRLRPAGRDVYHDQIGNLVLASMRIFAILSALIALPGIAAALTAAPKEFGAGAAPPSSVSGAPTSSGAAIQSWPNACEDWDEWDAPGPPVRIFANTYYVGTCGISAILITGKAGHILIDGGTEAGADLIAANIRALGFALSDVRILLHSHEHFDHVAGLASLQRQTGARLVASAPAAAVLSSGKDAKSDPQYGMHKPFPPAKVGRIVKHGETIALGDLALHAIATPGHTEGALSWRWKSCENGRCETIVYADSLSPVSADSYRFSDHPAYLGAYRLSLKRLAELPCTLLLTPHPSASEMRQRLQQGRLSDPRACADFAARTGARLDDRLAKERAAN